MKQEMEKALREAWGENPRPEIISTFYLGVAEGVSAGLKHNPNEVFALAQHESNMAHLRLRMMPWWRRLFIKA